jgi:hypothetical protein
VIKFFFLSVFFCGLVSCSSIEFVLNEKELDNRYKNNTLVVLFGKEGGWFSQEFFSYFGNQKNNVYILEASFIEKKENRLVKKNQVAEKIDYKIIVDYKLYFKDYGCNIFNKEISTKFSFIPKSFGYNFGASRSLEKLYLASIKKNINMFVDSSPKTNSCIK